MKIRKGFVSNSSSSSFVIFNWFDIPEEKRKYIKNYDENALKVWKKHNKKYKRAGNTYFFGKEEGGWNSEDPLNFGILNDIIRWYWQENPETNSCAVSTIMTNFEMDNWLKYNQIDFFVVEDHGELVEEEYKRV